MLILSVKEKIDNQTSINVELVYKLPQIGNEDFKEIVSLCLTEQKMSFLLA